jgi:uncharacterized protein YndB with AHSA1/START domain
MSHDYAVSKVVDAPASEVWKAWTTAEGTAGIFRARPETVTVDARPGGAFRVTMTMPDGSEDTVTGSYVELLPNERLVTRMDSPQGQAPPMVMDLEEVAAGRTKVTFSQSCTSAQERDFAKEGSTILLEWVADYVPKN